MKENDINIKNDEYYLFYKMMMNSLNIDNVEDGVAKSLDLLKKYLDANNVVLYKKNTNGVYLYKISDSNINELLLTLNCFVEKTNALIESKKIFNIDLNISDNLKNIISIFIKVEDKEYILLINAYSENKNIDESFFERLRDTMWMILKRALIYEKNSRAIYIDLLTELDNRNSYEIRLKELNNVENPVVFGIFDLFRLKHINDNYTHAVGDIYIKETAKILKKYWPKYKTIVSDSIEKNIETGHNIYRVGGDEFILLTSMENIELTKIKSNLAFEEIKMINLPIKEKPILGINYGITMHKPKDTIRQTYIDAEEIMAEDKKKMYLKYGLKRRI